MERENNFSISDAFTLLHAVRQEEPWATRVSFVYSAKEQAVYYAENNCFDRIEKFIFQSCALINCSVKSAMLIQFGVS